MEHRMQKMLMLTIGLLISLNTFAYDFEVDGIYYNILTIYGENQVEVTYGNEATNSYTMEKVVIPEKVEYGGTEFSVTTIGNQAFYFCDKIISVELPNTITTISAGSFACCSNLTTINIPSSVQSVGNLVFTGCPNLKEVHITDLSAWCRIKFTVGYFNINEGLLGNGSNLILNGEMVTDLIIPDDITEINDLAFAYCPGITSVTVGDNVRLIDSYAFANCSNLKEVTVSDNLELIGTDAFQGTAWLEVQDDGPIYLGNILCDYKGEMPENYDLQIENGTKAVTASLFIYGYNGNLRSVSIPASMKLIGTQAFSGGNNLEEINVNPDNERYCSIDGVLFDNTLKQLIVYPAKKSDIVYRIPEWVTDIYHWAFVYANNLLSVSMGDNVTSMGISAFAGCSNLSSIRLSENLKTIGDGAFMPCGRLKSISLPKSVTSVGVSAFGGCTSLEAIYSYNPVPPKLELGLDYNGNWESYAFDDDTYNNAFLIVPTGSATLYAGTEGWRNFKNIEEGLPNAGIESVDTSDINVLTRNSSIVVSGLDEKVTIEVYSVSGQLVYKGTETTISVPTKGIYIVRVAGQTFKVAL